MTTMTPEMFFDFGIAAFIFGALDLAREGGCGNSSRSRTNAGARPEATKLAFPSKADAIQRGLVDSAISFANRHVSSRGFRPMLSRERIVIISSTADPSFP